MGLLLLHQSTCRDIHEQRGILSLSLKAVNRYLITFVNILMNSYYSDVLNCTINKETLICVVCEKRMKCKLYF